MPPFRSAFEDAKRALEQQDKAKEAARKQAQKKWRDELTDQVEMHSARAAFEKEQERALGDHIAVRERRVLGAFQY